MNRCRHSVHYRKYICKRCGVAFVACPICSEGIVISAYCPECEAKIVAEAKEFDRKRSGKRYVEKYLRKGGAK